MAYFCSIKVCFQDYYVYDLPKLTEKHTLTFKIVLASVFHDLRTFLKCHPGNFFNLSLPLSQKTLILFSVFFFFNRVPVCLFANESQVLKTSCPIVGA